MIIFFSFYALVILLIFNSLTNRFCLKMEMNHHKQSRVYRMINIMILILLISSYVKITNAVV